MASHIRAVVDYDDIDFGHQAIDDLARLRFLKGEDKRLLSTVQCLKPLGFAGHELAELAPGFALGRFDLDHLGAHIGEVLAAEWAGDDLREFEDPDPRERSGCHHYPPRAGVPGRRRTAYVLHGGTDRVQRMRGAVNEGPGLPVLTGGFGQPPAIP